MYLELCPPYSKYYVFSVAFILLCLDVELYDLDPWCNRVSQII